MLCAGRQHPRPAAAVVPQPGGTTRAELPQLKQAGLDAMADAHGDPRGPVPVQPRVRPRRAGAGTAGQDASGALFGIGRSLYFCDPAEPEAARLLGHRRRPAVQDPQQREHRRASSQQLPLFDPPIDPGMLVKAAAAGLDIGSIVSGLNQPAGPVRSPCC